MPYFPPHIGGLEKVGQEIGKHWVQKEFGLCTYIVFDVGQIKNSNYLNNNCKVILIPSFDIILNFPFPKFWLPRFWRVLRSIQVDSNTRVITHTRFFLSSLIGGIFAKFKNLKWIHIEHGSDYVKLSSNLKNKIAYSYDRIVGKYIFKKADKVLVISSACQKFIEREFGRNDIKNWYRGVDFSIHNYKKTGEIKLVFIGRLVHLKGVYDLCKTHTKNNIKSPLIIIGEGEELANLKDKYGKNTKIQFLGQQSSEYIERFLSENKCILINPSYQEGMPTTVIEGLVSSNVVIASDVGGTKEISDEKDLIIFQAGDLEKLNSIIQYSLDNYETLCGLSKMSVVHKFDWIQSIEKFRKLI